MDPPSGVNRRNKYRSGLGLYARLRNLLEMELLRIYARLRPLLQMERLRLYAKLRLSQSTLTRGIPSREDARQAEPSKGILCTLLNQYRA